jgi:hypothetical protein
MKVIALLLAAVLYCDLIHAQVPLRINYQGVLTNPGGTPINTTVSLAVSLYDVAAGGAALYTETQTVAVSNGIFNMQIGAVAPLALPFDVPYYLGVAVNADAEMSPRQPLAASPYALRAANATLADSATNAAQLGGIDASQYLSTASAGNTFVKNDTAQQTAANFNIDGNGVVGDSLGIGAAPRGGIKLDVVGNALFTQTNGGAMQLGTPNGETGMSTIVGGGRADMRFDGTTIKLVAGLVGGPPSSANGIAIDTAGRVTIGGGLGVSKLEVTSTGFFQGGIRGTSIDDAGIFGKSTNYYGVYGESNGGGINSFAGFFNGRTHVGTLRVQGLQASGATSVCRNANSELAFCSSSLRYKKDVQAFEDGLDVVTRLRPIAYRWKADDMTDVGFGAEDVAKINPLFVSHNDKGEVEGVKYDRLSTVFVNAFKEQQTQIEQQQNQIQGLKKLVCLSHPGAEVCMGEKHGTGK